MAQYKLHIFKSSNNFTVSSLTGNPAFDTAEYMIVGGGGAGVVGAGGAGGLLFGNASLSATTYSMVVGAGRAGGQVFPVTRADDSSGFGVTAFGGGAGGYNGPGGGPGYPGGSGGGGAAHGWPGGSGRFATGTAGQGNNGGPEAGSGFAALWPAGGGGGAGSAGLNVQDSPVAGSGGIGKAINWGLPTDYGTPGPTPGRWFAGGGGGSTLGGVAGTGGAGGGGDGGGPPPIPGTSGATNTGGGGGGYGPGTGGNGGSGIVIIKYPVITPPNPPKISSITDVSTSANTYYGDQTVTLQVTTENVVTDETLFYSVNNASNSQVVGGNTGSFIITSNNYVEVPVTLNIVGTSNISMQVRRNSGTGTLLGESENVTIVERLIAGGTITEDELYVTHVFTSTANLIVSASASNTEANVLLVAGGGGSGGAFNGGGGAGGMLEIPVTLVLGEYTIIVGAGGIGIQNGTPSSGFGTTVTGGGRGAYYNGVSGQPGGSGGGGGGLNGTGAAAGTGISGQGNPGSVNVAPLLGGNGYSGAGGGAGGAGNTNPFAGGSGRISTISPINYGTNSSNSPTPGGDRYFAGGGAGMRPPAATGTTGGAGGGGNSKSNGAVNTGGGAGGGPYNNSVTAIGGSGIAIIRYAK